MNAKRRRLFYLNPGDWTWWAWSITAGLLMVGLSGHNMAFIAAMGLTAAQGIILFVRERRVTAFSVQLRVAYLLLLVISYPDAMRWLYWVPAIGTFALTTVGYCLLARVLSLFPWNSGEAYTFSRIRRTFLSAPNLDRVAATRSGAACAGGLCTIEAQVVPLIPTERVEHAKQILVCLN